MISMGLTYTKMYAKAYLEPNRTFTVEQKRFIGDVTLGSKLLTSSKLQPFLLKQTLKIKKKLKRQEIID